MSNDGVNGLNARSNRGRGHRSAPPALPLVDCRADDPLPLLAYIDLLLGTALPLLLAYFYELRVKRRWLRARGHTCEGVSLSRTAALMLVPLCTLLTWQATQSLLAGSAWLAGALGSSVSSA